MGQHNTKLIKMNCLRQLLAASRYLLCVSILFGFVGSLFAQQAQMKMALSKPEWDGKTVCGSEKGYLPKPITSPSFSYSGKLAHDPVYNYKWEQRVGNENWKVVAEGNKVEIIPAFYPKPLIPHAKSNAKETFSWRVQVTDVSNGNKTLISDTYSLTLIAPMQVSVDVSLSDKAKQLYRFTTEVNGGMGTKSFEWTALDAKAQVPSNEKVKQNPSGMPPGKYRLIVRDEGCPHITKEITTINQHKQ
jgi:hypothetical protein